MALDKCLDKIDKRPDKKLEEDLIKFWMMAHCCNPQFVIRRSVTCTAPAAFCLPGAMTLAEATLWSYLMPWSWSFKLCVGDSDYKWSTIMVLFMQTVAVGVGPIAPAIRWFTAVKFWWPTRGKNSHKWEFKAERYWIQLLVQISAYPINCMNPGSELQETCPWWEKSIVDPLYWSANWNCVGKKNVSIHFYLHYSLDCSILWVLQN